MGCGETAKIESGKPVILVSVQPQKYFLDRLTGDLTENQLLIPPGFSAERYEPTMRQLTTLSKAKLYFTIGHSHFPFEADWIAKLRTSADLKIVPASEGLQLIEDDPHLWIAPVEVKEIVSRMALALKQLLPQNAAEIEQRLAKLLNDVAQVEDELDLLLSPKKGGVFIIYHPELGYLARQYELRQLAIEHEGKEAGAHSLASLVEFGKQHQISVILAQPQYSAAGAEVLARELNSRIALIDPLAYDWLANTRIIGARLAEAVSNAPTKSN